MECRCTLKEVTPSETSWWLQKIKTLFKEECSHLQIQMWQGGVWWRVYWRIFKTFWREVQRTPEGPFYIFEHYNITGHNVTIDNFSNVRREDQNLMRTIKEALYIRVNNPSLNRTIGKYHLPHIWDEVLINTSELKLK